MVMEQSAVAMDFLRNRLQYRFVPFSPERGAEEREAAPDTANEEAFKGGLLTKNPCLTHHEVGIAFPEGFQLFFVIEEIGDGLFESSGPGGREKVEKRGAEVAFEEIGFTDLVPGGNGLRDIGLFRVAVEMKMEIDGKVVVPIPDRNFGMPDGGVMAFENVSFLEGAQWGSVEGGVLLAVVSEWAGNLFDRDIRGEREGRGGDSPPFTLELLECGFQCPVEGDFPDLNHIHAQQPGRKVVPELRCNGDTITGNSPVGIQHALFGGHGEEFIFFHRIRQIPFAIVFRFFGVFSHRKERNHEED